MSTIIGRYVRTFAEADTGMIDGVSLNAPYPFFWVEVKEVADDRLTCSGAGELMVLPIRRTRSGERAKVQIQDPLFGPQWFDVLPFAQKPRQGALL